MPSLLMPDLRVVVSALQQVLADGRPIGERDRYLAGHFLSKVRPALQVAAAQRVSAQRVTTFSTGYFEVSWSGVTDVTIPPFEML